MVLPTVFGFSVETSVYPHVSTEGENTDMSEEGPTEKIREFQTLFETRLAGKGTPGLAMMWVLMLKSL